MLDLEQSKECFNVYSKPMSLGKVSEGLFYRLLFRWGMSWLVSRKNNVLFFFNLNENEGGVKSHFINKQIVYFDFFFFCFHQFSSLWTGFESN